MWRFKLSWSARTLLRASGPPILRSIGRVLTWPKRRFSVATPRLSAVEMSKISFLIATDDHPPDLDRFFGALINQTLPHHYMVIIDTTRSHGHAEACERARARKDAGLRLHFEAIDKGGRAKALNRGLQLCLAPVILFFADDSMATPQTAEAHLRFHEANPSLHQVGVGSMILAEDLRTHFTTWLERSGELFGVPFSDDMTSVPEKFFTPATARSNVNSCAQPARSTRISAITPGTITSSACD